MFKTLTIIIAVVATLGILLTGAYGETVKLSWVAPTTNSDNSVLTDLAGFKIYEHLGANFIERANVSVGQLTTTLTVPAGNHCFVATAYDDKIPANESLHSNEVCADILDTTAPATFVIEIIGN